MIRLPTPAIARIHAHICGDGSFYKKREKRSPGTLLKHKRRNIYRTEHILEYYNLSRELLDEFKMDFKIAFNRNIQTNRNKIQVRGAKRIAEDLQLIGKNSYTWYIPFFISESSKTVIGSWIRAFFDDEAYVDPTRDRILVKCMNKNGLEQVVTLLQKLHINSKITGPNCDKSYYLVVKKDGLNMYHDQIGFTMHRKKEALNKIIEKLVGNGATGTFRKEDCSSHQFESRI